MTEFVLMFSLSCGSIVTGLECGDVESASQRAAAPPIAAASTNNTDLVGLTAFRSLVKWLRGLPAAFESFVGREERDQLVRYMEDVSDAFSAINGTCTDLARRVEESTTQLDDLDAPFDALLKNIVVVRDTLGKLATKLGFTKGPDGAKLPFELARLTQTRADLTSEAKKQVFGGNRDAAARRLREAAALAEEAQKLVIGYVPTLKK